MKTLDAITTHYTAFTSFDDLVKSATEHNYSPTLRGWNKESWEDLDWLAECFDTVMANQGSASRAHPKR